MGSTQAPRKLHASFRGRGLKTRVRGSAGEPEKVSYFSPHSLFQRYVRAAEVNCSAGPSTEVETVAAEVARKCPRFLHSSILFSSLSYFVLSYPIVSYLIVSCPIVSCPILSYHVLSWSPILSINPSIRRRGRGARAAGRLRYEEGWRGTLQ